MQNNIIEAIEKEIARREKQLEMTLGITIKNYIQCDINGLRKAIEIIKTAQADKKEKE